MSNAVEVQVKEELCEIPLANLLPSDVNMRAAAKPVDPKADAEMKANLKAEGVLQNLIVHPMPAIKTRRKKNVPAGDCYGVADGRRRYNLLMELADAGEIDPKTYFVPCRIVSRMKALSSTISANRYREDPHPIDEFLAFKRLVEAGAEKQDIAVQFGVTTNYIDQRLALGSVHPAILDAFREGDIALDAVTAFTVEPDTAKQLKVFKGLSYWVKRDPREIRTLLVKSEVSHRDRRVKFVTLDAYQKAGGSVSGDLFGEDVRVLDVKLLEKLIQEKIDAQVTKLEAEGWKEVDVEPDGWTNSWQFTQEKPDTGRKYSEKQKKRCRAVIEIGYDGKVKIHRAIKIGKGGASSSSSTKKKAGAQGEDGPKAPTYSQALTDDLGRLRETGLKVALSRVPALALELLHFQLCDRYLRDEGGTSEFIGVSDHYRDRVLGLKEQEAEPVTIALHEFFESLPSEWKAGDTAYARLQAWRELPQEDRDRLATAAVLCSVHIRPRCINDFSDAVIDEMNVNFREFFTPSVANLFGRISRPHMLEILKGIEGGDLPAGFDKSMKKDATAQYMEQYFKEGRGPDWLPEAF